MMKLTKELAYGLSNNQPTVALESTLICHGIPKPRNAELARTMETRVRTQGALPATMAVIGGVVQIGLSDEALQKLADAEDVTKCSTRDLPLVAAQGGLGATTVAATIHLAAKQGIRVMATGGLGGVHRGGETSLDISADLYELQRSPVAVVCCGVKSILDQRRTMEQLETLGVPVVGFGCDRLPAFYTADSDIEIPRVDTLDQLAAMVKSHQALGLSGGIVIAVPPPEAEAMSGETVDILVDAAGKAADAAGIIGPAQTPFMLRHMAEASEGRTVTLNCALAANNATLAAALAVRL